MNIICILEHLHLRCCARHVVVKTAQAGDLHLQIQTCARTAAPVPEVEGQPATIERHHMVRTVSHLSSQVLTRKKDLEA